MALSGFFAVVHTLGARTPGGLGGTGGVCLLLLIETFHPDHPFKSAFPEDPRVATLSVPQDPDKPQLKMRLLRGNPHFYLEVESDHPVIPTLMPLRITATNFRDAKREALKLLHIIRGSVSASVGQDPGFARGDEGIRIGNTCVF